MKISLKNPIHFFATGFGSGLLKPAPGTWGSLVGTLIAIFIWHITESRLFFFFLAFLGFFIGCWLCQKTGEDTGIHDDGRIVWDEIIAIWLIFTFLPEYNWLYYGLSFIFFRLFDIWKPSPIRYFDAKLENGVGVMLDDIFAAIYALLALYIIHWSYSC